MLITAAMHHPSVGWWAYSALIVWFAERAWRGTWWFYINGIFKRKVANSPPREVQTPRGLKSFSLHSRASSNASSYKRPEYEDRDSDPLIRRSSRVPATVESLMSPPPTFIPPAGYGHAELLPGKTIRLAILTPECRPWAPGQHFLLSIPSINKFTSHPFTVGSVCDQQSSNPSGRILIFFIRAKAGWTKTLWDTVVALSVRDKFHCDGEEPPEGTYPPSRGVLLRTFVEGPFGSVARTDWIEYSTVLLVAGGSGVSFGLSVLVYLCLCLSGRASHSLGGSSKPFSRVSRVRFVWLAREFCTSLLHTYLARTISRAVFVAHIQWCASILRRCMALVPGSLHIDIFVTNAPKDALKSMPPAGPPSEKSGLHAPQMTQPSKSMEDVSLDGPPMIPIHIIPPHEKGRNRLSQASFNYEYNALVAPSIGHSGGSGGGYGDGGIKESDYDLEMAGDGHGPSRRSQEDRHYDVLDYTHFNGDLDAEVVPAEESFSRRLREEGAMRRKQTRKMTLGYDSSRNSSWVNVDEAASPTLVSTPGDMASPFSLPSSRGHGRSASADLQSPGMTGGKHARKTSNPADLSKLELGRLERPRGNRESSSSSIRNSVMDVSAVQLMMPKVGKGARGEEMKIHFSEEELDDVLAMTEYAWPGRPMLDKLLQEEVENAKGALVVACEYTHLSHLAFFGF